MDFITHSRREITIIADWNHVNKYLAWPSTIWFVPKRKIMLPLVYSNLCNSLITESKPLFATKHIIMQLFN